MDYTVIFGHPSLRDLAKIHQFIAQDSEVTAGAFAQRLMKEAKSLANFPHRGGHYEEKPGARFIVVGSYLIVYRMIEATREARILRFWHSARERRSS